MMSSLHRRLLDYRNPASLVNRMRRKRFMQLKRLLMGASDGESLHILDIGGTYHYWMLVSDLLEVDWRVSLLNLKKEKLPEKENRIFSISGDARDADFDFRQYGFIFSNSLIEHLGSREAMKVFARCVKDSTLPFYIQTPSKWFPLEPHCRIPLFQFFPRRLRAFLIFHLRIKYFPAGQTYSDCLKVSDSTIMLSRKEMHNLFPEATIETERMMGMPKSYAAWRLHS